ncbi:hypothetical protein BDN72DRAFT_893607 [Pluteus cervinus]|uniref:Uncharacterized protein n=1 Tax=Pluteus cervinus TaxID=181527 RepID=A0ACD3B6X5_9AGAR|nr:hypothetical protein BDN72DRAFT_893607 [Pluteus cervinus]
MSSMPSALSSGDGSELDLAEDHSEPLDLDGDDSQRAFPFFNYSPWNSRHCMPEQADSGAGGGGGDTQAVDSGWVLSCPSSYSPLGLTTLPCFAIPTATMGHRKSLEVRLYETKCTEARQGVERALPCWNRTGHCFNIHLYRLGVGYQEQDGRTPGAEEVEDASTSGRLAEQWKLFFTGHPIHHGFSPVLQLRSPAMLFLPCVISKIYQGIWRWSTFGQSTSSSSRCQGRFTVVAGTSFSLAGHVLAHPLSSLVRRSSPIRTDDDDASIFLASSSRFSNLFPPPLSSQPPRTPVKQAHRVPSWSALSVKHINNNIATPAFPSALAPSVGRVGGGTKRKSTAQASTTPLRPHTLTPLRTVSPKRTDKATSSNGGFDQLAPLATPKFMVRTPQTKAEADVHLRKQTASLTKLKITDFDGSDFGDPGCEIEDDDDAEALFRGSVRLKGKMSAGQLLLGRAKGDHEVVEAVSPGGHVNKRRARSRPVSNELLNRTYASPAATPSPKKPVLSKSNTHRTPTTAVAFPSAVATLDRTRTTSTSSHSSAGGSPAPRRRVTGSVNSNRYLPRLSQPSLTVRRPLARLESSGTLFFGPTIPPPPLEPALIIKPMKLNPPDSRQVKTRHSYAGPSNIWNTMQSPPKASSPFSSPVPLPCGHSRNLSDDDEQDLFFGSGPREPSFIFNLTKGTPSPRPKMVNRLSLPTKYKPRDSGISLSDEEDVNMVEDTRPPNRLTVMPRASTSVNSILSDAEDGLITPGVASDHNSSWPGNIFVRNADDRHDFESELGNDGYVDVDAFIVRTLAAPPKTSQAGPKKAPGTPVKSRKLGLSARPWQSAVANKVGLADWDTNTKKGKVPRKSLPAAFPPLNRKPAKPLLDSLTDSEGEEDSPSGRRDKYLGLGLGRPPAPAREGSASAVQRTRWLMRRSSSGAFSNGSDPASMNATPTRTKGKGMSLWFLSTL